MPTPAQGAPASKGDLATANRTVRREKTREVLESFFLGTKKRIYLTTAALCVAFGCIAFTVPSANLLARLALAVSESLLVALVLAIAIDPYLKVTGFRETAQQISESFFWESVSPYCPVEYRDRIKELASSPIFASSNLTTVEFAWAPDHYLRILQVTITRDSLLRNTSAHPYSPNRHLWVLGSTPGFESQYLLWRLVDEAQDFNETLERGELMPYVSLREDDALVLNESELMRHFHKPPVIYSNAVFSTQQKGRMYRHARGYLPIVHGMPVANGRLRCTGPALKDLALRCMFAGRQLDIEDDGSSRPTYRQPRLAAPGEGFLLGWKLKAEG
jgi:hypothetical protein